MGNPLFRTKSIERILADSDAPEHRLKRTLTAWDLTGLGIGAIIGTGIFVLIGTAIVGDAHRPGAGPGIMLSFILSGITCALAALCYAEFAAMIPVAGSAYTYSYATLGEFLAWLTGWNLILEYGVACVAVAIGWSGYFNNILKLCGLELPYWATHPPGADGGIANIPAAIIVLLVTCILIVGVKESARATCGIVLIKLAVIAFFIAVGTSSVDTANWSPSCRSDLPASARPQPSCSSPISDSTLCPPPLKRPRTPTGFTHRDLRLAGHLHRALYFCGRDPDRISALFANRRSCPGSGRAPHGRIQVGSRHRGNRCGSGHYQCPGGDDAGPDSGLFRHVAGRSPGSLAFRRPSEVSNAPPRHLFDRRGRRHHGRTHSDR